MEEINRTQFWMNLIELTSLHDEMTAEQALLIAQKSLIRGMQKLNMRD